MLPLLTCEQMRALDRAAIAAGIPGRVLMENAATAALSVIQAEHPAYAAIFCGKGNNAGDGFALGRRLFVSGIPTEIVLCADPSSLSDDAEANYKAACRIGVPTTSFADFQSRASLPDRGVLVDALLGTGIRGPVQGTIEAAITYMNESGCRVVSLDIPSGICGDTGKVHGTAVRADKTVTFGCRKPGLYSPLSIDYVGEVLWDDISIPAPKEGTRFLIEKQDIKLPVLSRAAHKGTRGHAVVLGGSVGMAGAVRMAAQSAEYGGAGLVTAMVPAPLMPVMMRSFYGSMCTSIEDEIPSKANAILVGPGLGREKAGEAALCKAVSFRCDTLIIDADGLYHLADNKHLLQAAAKKIILTPHLGEMSRLCGLSTEEIAENRVQIAEEFASAYGVTLVLKGAHTVVADPAGITYINMTGNAGMAKGGSGDILAGLLCGLAASGAENPALAGVYLHGLAGDYAAEAYTPRALTAEIIMNFLPKAIKCM
ncbi:MAG: NAD(P)H-hydrate dehydratase [Ruminococcaceae bacterium]|nr:NAD(P)H-hydrate dehydratase [Oscillospiraceae bacterium]